MADEFGEGGGGQPEGGGGGSPSDHHMLADLWHDHRTPLMIAIAAATMLLTAVLVFRKSGTGAAAGQHTAAGGTPTSMTSDSTAAMSSLTGYMQAILNQLQQLGSGATPTPALGSGATPTPTPGSGAGGTSGGGGGGGGSRPPTPGPRPHDFVTTARWQASHTPWNSTMWGIAQHEGMPLSRLEHLNPQISNPDVIQPDQKVYVN